MIPAPHTLGIVSIPVSLALHRQRYEGRKFKVVLLYEVRSRPVMGEVLSKKLNCFLSLK